MILPAYLEEKVEEFCKEQNIEVINGRIPMRYQKYVHNYIEKVLKSDRARTRSQQYFVKGKIGFVLNSMIGDFKVSSPIEVLLWEALEKNGLISGAVKQHPIGKCKIDIAYPDKKLAIECDGREYHRENYEQIERDQKRDKYLARKGWRTLRIEGVAIHRNINLCVRKINEKLQT